MGTGYVSGGIGRTFRNGISVRPGVTAYPSSGASVAQTMGLTQLRPSLGLQIPLLRGLGETAADAVERAAQETLKGTSLAREFAIASLVNDTVQIYWRCLATDQVARNSKEFDQRATDYETSLAKLAGKGLIEPTVAQRAKAMAVSRRRQCANRPRMRRRIAAAIWRPRPVRLRRGGGSRAAAGDAGDGRHGRRLDGLQEEALVTLALENRADFKAAGENVAAADAKLDGARDSTAPTPESGHRTGPRHCALFPKHPEQCRRRAARTKPVAASSQARIALSQLQTQIRQQVSVTLRNLQNRLCRLEDAERRGAADGCGGDRRRRPRQSGRHRPQRFRQQPKPADGHPEPAGQCPAAIRLKPGDLAAGDRHDRSRGRRRRTPWPAKFVSPAIHD